MFFTPRVLLARRLRGLPPRAFAAAKHLLFHGELTTLRHPVGYAQMAAARNLAEPGELVHRTADKYAVRAYVAERIGAEHLIPLVGLITRPEEIDAALLRKPCVVKGTHGCDMTILLPEGAARDVAAVRGRVAPWLATDFFREGWRETPYRGLPRRAVVERFLGDGAPPADHKFFVFHGEPAMVVVDRDRFSGHTASLMTPDWRPLAATNGFAAAPAPPARPENLAAMLDIAGRLAADFDFARIDLYDVDGRIWFGEITHFPGGGIVPLRPRAFDRALGKLWRDGTPIPQGFIGRP